jgi:hypothetical protein
MAKPKDKPLKIDIPEDAALRAFLKTPPPSVERSREMVKRSRELMVKTQSAVDRGTARKKP